LLNVELTFHLVIRLLHVSFNHARVCYQHCSFTHVNNSSLLSTLTCHSSSLLCCLLGIVRCYALSWTTSCDQLKLPTECHCQPKRYVNTSHIGNDRTRLRCRSLTELTSNDRWPAIAYERLTFDTPHDYLIVHRRTFAGLNARTLRFNVEHLVLHENPFHRASIGELFISHQDSYGSIKFDSNRVIFYQTTITSLVFQSIDFRLSMSESIFFQTRIYAFQIQSSIFVGFARWNSSQMSIESDEALAMSDTFDNRQTLSMTIYSIISSINTSHLTDEYLPQHVDYSGTDEIRLTNNHIRTVDEHAFRYCKNFRGRLILTHNHIEYLHDESFNDLNALTYLSLANNILEDLSWPYFQYFKHLIELDLSNNRIQRIHNGTFQSLIHLRILRLNFNPLKSLDSNVFASLTNLKEIYFHRGQVHQIDQHNSIDWLWNLAFIHVRSTLYHK
jgi:hypothetical protein